MSLMSTFFINGEHIQRLHAFVLVYVKYSYDRCLTLGYMNANFCFTSVLTNIATQKSM